MMFDINRVAKVTKPGEKPLYSHHGHVIDKDGTVYALYHKWWHGAIIALIYPEEAASFTMDGKRNFVIKMCKDEQGEYAETIDSDKLHWPETGDHEDVNVFAFQEFEHSVHRRLQLVRVCPSRMSGMCSIDVPRRLMEPAQLQSLLAVVKELGIEKNDTISFDHRDMKWSEALRYLHNAEYVEANDEDNEPDEVDPNEPSELDIDPVTHPSYNKGPSVGESAEDKDAFIEHRDSWSDDTASSLKEPQPTSSANWMPGMPDQDKSRINRPKREGEIMPDIRVVDIDTVDYKFVQSKRRDPDAKGAVQVHFDKDAKFASDWPSEESRADFEDATDEDKGTSDE